MRNMTPRARKGIVLFPLFYLTSWNFVLGQFHCSRARQHEATSVGRLPAVGAVAALEAAVWAAWPTVSMNVRVLLCSSPIFPVTQLVMSQVALPHHRGGVLLQKRRRHVLGQHVAAVLFRRYAMYPYVL